MTVGQLSKSLILSCLIFLATLPAFAQSLLNSTPFRDFATDLNLKLIKGEVDLSKSFFVTFEGALTENGRFDAKRSSFIKSEGDPQMVEVAKNAIEALGDSGLLNYLSALKIVQIRIDFSQNENTVSVIVTSEQSNENKAKTIASGFNTLINIVKVNVMEDEAQTLINATKITTEGRNFVINFAMPKAEAQRLLKNELQKAREKSYSSKVNKRDDES